MDKSLAFLFVLVLGLSGCAKKNGDPFWRYWAAVDGTENVDLNGGKFERGLEKTQAHRVPYASSDGSRCECEFWADGDYYSGTYAISNCTLTSAVTTDDCVRTQSGSYESDLVVLKLCPNDDPDECREYK